MAALIPGMENISINLAGYISQIMYWVGIILASAVSIGVIYFIYHSMSFKISATIFPLYGSGKDGVFSVGLPKRNKIKWVNNHTAWKSLWPLFNKKQREPFDSEMIYPGNKIYVFSLNDEWSPGRININQSESQIRAEINPVPFVVRNWQSLEHKKNAMEFAQHNWWEDNKYFMMGVVSVLICCALCLATIYFTYKFTTGGVQASQALTEAIKNFGSIGG
ncbi:MAG: hypothetical protein KKD01_19510 [Proteobacteria bacterium]|nr:hypothetical protein [Pseudomonadota bacterium]